MKKGIYIFLAVMLLINLISINSVYASDMFVNVPIKDLSNSGLTSNGFNVLSGKDYKAGASVSDMYIACYRNANDSNRFHIVVLTPTDYRSDDTTVLYRSKCDGIYFDASGSSGINTITGRNFYSVSTSGIPANWAGSYTPNVPIYETYSSLLNAFEGFMNNGFTNPVSSTITVPCGNVLIIENNNSVYNFNLATTFKEYSALIGNPFSNSQYYFYTDTLPDNISYSVNNMVGYISWARSSNGRNLVGQTKQAISSISTDSSWKYLVIVNPMFEAQSTNKVNGDLIVSNIPNGINVYVYGINTSLSDGIIVNDIDINNSGAGTTEYSGGNVILHNPSDNTVIYNPSYGGVNGTNFSDNIDETVQSLKEILQEFFQSVLDILGKPVSYIKSVINAGSGFVQHLTGMWAWLPNDVSSIITSVLVVMVGVAVFKVFL